LLRNNDVRSSPILRASYTEPSLAAIPNTVFDLLEEVMALADRTLLLRLRRFASGIIVSIGGKNAVTLFRDTNSSSFVVPARSSDAQQMQLKTATAKPCRATRPSRQAESALHVRLNFSRHPFIQFLYIHSASCAKGTVQWL
jgi:hypothetical protein